MVRLLGSACVYGQVLKTRRNNRVVRVERRVTIGTASRLNAALLASEGYVAYCVQKLLSRKSGHGTRLLVEVDLLTKE